MIRSKLLVAVLCCSVFTGCTVKEEVVDYSIEKQNSAQNIVEKKTIKTSKTIEKVEEVSSLNSGFATKNQNKFYEILKSDRYSSLCGSVSKFNKLKNENLSEKKTELIEELFVEYTNNLANSCIDVKSFKQKLSAKKYDDRNQDYEVYETPIDNEKILAEFREDSKSVKTILDKYKPLHPDFDKFVKALNANNLSKSEHNKLKLNIERLKLLKYSGSNDFVQLNIPSTDFTFYENDKVIKKFNTVVGEPETQTPVLSSNLSYFVINPTWNIPDSIAKSSIIPKALKDRNYLKSKNIVIRQNYNLDSKKINFKDVKWKQYLKADVKYIPYKFIQLPSPKNGMGRLKFLFKNDYAVYMHDTIGSWRFKHKNQNLRFASHGCVRLENPLAFMKHISENYTSQGYSRTKGIYDNLKTGNVNLNKKLPVHLTYITSYVKDGKVGFYQDRYGYDQIQKLNF